MRLRPIVWILALSVGGVSCHRSAPPLMPRPLGLAVSGSLAGTYSIWFCSAVCDTTRLDSAVARGFLVLDTIPLIKWRHTGVSKDTRLHWLQGLLPGACFTVVASHPGRGRSGLVRRGLSGWRRQAPDSVTGILFVKGPDARYTSALRVDTVAGTLEGLARPAGYGFPRGGEGPPDHIVGRRLGTVDRTVCTRNVD